MVPPSDALDYDEYVRTVFGFDPSAAKSRSKSAPARPASTPRGKPAALAPVDPASRISQAAGDPKVWTNAVGPALSRQGPGRPGARIKAPAPVGEPKVCTGPGGKEVTVAKTSDGRVAITRDPPVITEITFSGGGGKGAALPGAVKALTESGVLKGAKQIHGASVGSMTAAMIAAGVTPEAFQKISDDTKFGPLIKGGDMLMVNVSGDGLEDLVRGSMNSSLNAQIAKFAESAMMSGQKVDPQTVDTLKAMTDKFSKGNGPTFGDLRVLSKIIPDIKEVVITGTLIGKSEQARPEPAARARSRTASRKWWSSARTRSRTWRWRGPCTPRPRCRPVFKPVEIPLASGEIGKFEDGGVLNNAPTSDNLGTDRGVDPVPETGKMTFVFEEDASQQILAGKATPDRSRVNDFVAGAENSAADFAKNRGLGGPAGRSRHGAAQIHARRRRRRQEEGCAWRRSWAARPGASSARHCAGRSEGDFSGLLKAMNFDIAKDDSMKLQDMTQKATEAHLESARKRRPAPSTPTAQMFCAPRGTTSRRWPPATIPGAKDALRFRDDVTKSVVALEALAAEGGTAADKKAQALLKRMTGCGGRSGAGRLYRAGAEPQRQAGQASSPAQGGPRAGRRWRRWRRGGRGRRAGGPQDRAADPEGNRVSEDGARGAEGRRRDSLLEQMDTALRDARSNADINRALRMGIPYFTKKFDAGGVLGHADFAAR